MTSSIPDDFLDLMAGKFRMLAEAGLVARRKDGLQVFYALNDTLVERLCKLVCDMIVQETRQQLDRQRGLLDRWDVRA